MIKNPIIHDILISYGYVPNGEGMNRPPVYKKAYRVVPSYNQSFTFEVVFDLRELDNNTIVVYCFDVRSESYKDFKDALIIPEVKKILMIIYSEKIMIKGG